MRCENVNCKNQILAFQGKKHMTYVILLLELYEHNVDLTNRMNKY